MVDEAATPLKFDGSGSKSKKGTFIQRFWKPMALAGVLVVVVAAIAIVAVTHIGDDSSEPQPPPPPPTPSERACKVFCDGPILHAVQMARLYNDSKEFVDMPMKKSPEDILLSFSQLGEGPTRAELQKWVNDNFDVVGSDLDIWEPTDFQQNPALVGRISNNTVASWARGLNNLWKVLGRQVDPSVITQPERHSLLPMKHPFVVPGGRFRENYYWDSYWIIRGLLSVGMNNTAMKISLNMMEQVLEYGFVPNGARIYYLQRSQPPLLSFMAREVFEATQNETYLKEILPALTKEYAYWMDSNQYGNAVKITVQKGQKMGTTYTLNRYSTDSPRPRPESYTEDYETGVRSGLTGDALDDLYREIAAGAETGWDFSSRWMRNSTRLDTMDTSRIVPVELNAYLYGVEQWLAEAYQIVDPNGDPADAQKFLDAAAARLDAMEALLYNEDAGQWHDYSLDNQGQLARHTAANFAPLWTCAFKGGADRLQLVTNAVKASPLWQIGGVSTTDKQTGQQWDWPNGWPPLQHIIVEGLAQRRCNHTWTVPVDATNTARDLASRWLQSGLEAWQREGVMYEKYDVTRPGHTGGGGEYVHQTGFGWSNGVILSLMEEYYAN